MRRTTIILLAFASLGLLAVGQCAPPPTDEKPVPILKRLVKRIAGVEGMVKDTKRAICALYLKTGNEGMLPDFCPEPPGACEQPNQPGPCRAFLPRYGFDSETGQCEQFIYGGCGGNDNNFASLADCRDSCEAPPPVCEQPIEIGPCDAAIPRWGFDPVKKSCRHFFYGGCAGNENNFETLEECEDVCPAEPIPVCELPKDVGPCLALIPRWFHNAETGQCEAFNWGGCGGNANNFESRAECESACVRSGVCSLQSDRGPCLALIPRWFHNPDTGQCEQFNWGGCGGNGNKFETLAECERACPACGDDFCPEHEECRLHDDPTCRDPQACVEPFCADVCDEGACPDGLECRLVDVQCVRAPCPPIRQCVPPDPCDQVHCQDWEVCEVHPPTQQPYCRDTCNGFPCEPDEVCVLRDVVCVMAPCPPIATCEELGIANP